MKRDWQILTTFCFLLGLALLLLNDFVFKGLYGNWLTGKLSDFAGLFIFPLFWTSVFPKNKNNVFWLIGIFFILWKSPYSQEIIDSWNNLGIIPIARVVDYSDLIALSILPLAYYVDHHKSRLKSLTIHPALPLCIAIFSFIATSFHTKVPINKTYTLSFSKDTLINRFARIDSLNSGFGITFTQENPDTVNFSFPSQFCSNDFEVTVSIAELINNKTLLTLIRAEHGCQEESEDRKRLIKEFEKVIVDKIRNTH